MSNITLDPRKAFATVEIVAEFDEWLEDADGHNGPDRKRYALRLKRKFSKMRDPETALLMDAENRGIEHIVKKTGLHELRGQSSRDADSGALSVGFNIDSMADVLRLRKLFDAEGRAYFVDYGEASGLTLLPQGVNGPILRTESSPYRRGSDLDDWIEAHTKPARKAPKRRTTR